jgi:hypothetical protein
VSLDESAAGKLDDDQTAETKTPSRNRAATVMVMAGIGLSFTLLSIFTSIRRSREAPPPSGGAAPAPAALNVAEWVGKRVEPKSAAFRLHDGEAVEIANMLKPFYRATKAEGARLQPAAELSGQKSLCCQRDGVERKG